LPKSYRYEREYDAHYRTADGEEFDAHPGDVREFASPPDECWAPVEPKPKPKNATGD
jgi:hypothetical protein